MGKQSRQELRELWASSGVLFRIGSVTLEVQRGFDAQVLADVIRSLMEVC